MNINHGLRYLLHKDFDSLIAGLKNEYNRIVEENASLREMVAGWNKDDEIVKAKNEAEYYRRHSLHELSDDEVKKISGFRNRHYKSCKNAGTYIFELAGTGIGEAISIKCPVCGQEENVTDYSNW